MSRLQREAMASLKIGKTVFSFLYFSFSLSWKQVLKERDVHRDLKLEEATKLLHFYRLLRPHDIPEIQQ